MQNNNSLLASTNEIRFFSILGVLLLILLVLSFIMGMRVERGSISKPTEVATPFTSVAISAKSAYVLDIRTEKVLYEKNADTRLPLASLTKVMTALVATDMAEPSSMVVVTRDAVQADGDSGLAVGERWSLKNLLDFSLTSSSNDGAHAVGLALGALGNPDATATESEDVFVHAMNEKAEELNMKNTYYLNDTGLDESTTKSGAYGTAHDMAVLFAYILKNHPEMMEATRKSAVRVSSYDTIHTATNTDTLVNDIPNLKASKTGFTDLAGGNLAVAFDPEIGRPIVIVVLGSTEEGRFNDVLTLVHAALQSVSADKQ